MTTMTMVEWLERVCGSFCMVSWKVVHFHLTNADAEFSEDFETDKEASVDSCVDVMEAKIEKQ